MGYYQNLKRHYFMASPQPHGSFCPILTLLKVSLGPLFGARGMATSSISPWQEKEKNFHWGVDGGTSHVYISPSPLGGAR